MLTGCLSLSPSGSPPTPHFFLLLACEKQESNGTKQVRAPVAARSSVMQGLVGSRVDERGKNAGKG
jgi:hypothetical protein